MGCKKGKQDGWIRQLTGCFATGVFPGLKSIRCKDYLLDNTEAWG
jgi:hypothetical protein